MTEFSIEKCWKCGSGAIFTRNPKGLETCLECTNCSAKKGLGIEFEDLYLFIEEDRIKKVLE